MVRVSYHQITITTLGLALACGILACATSRWSGGNLFQLGDDATGNSIKALAIIGVAFIGFGLLLEILMVVSSTFKASRAINLLCLVCCIIAVAGMLIGLLLYASEYRNGGYSVWLFTASTVFCVEALFFYIVQWQCP